MDTEKSKHRLLVAVLVLTLATGALFSYLDEASLAFTLGTGLYWIAVDILILRWFVLDAGQRDYPLPIFSYILFFFFLVIMAPIYFIETRRDAAWRSILWSLGFVALMAAAMVGGLYAGSLLAPAPV